MEIVIVAFVAAGVAGAVVCSCSAPAPWARRSRPPRTAKLASLVGRRRVQEQWRSAQVPVARGGLDEELLARRAEIARLEERLRAKEGSVDVRSAARERERSLDDRTATSTTSARS